MVVQIGDLDDGSFGWVPWGATPSPCGDVEIRHSIFWVKGINVMRVFDDEVQLNLRVCVKFSSLNPPLHGWLKEQELPV